MAETEPRSRDWFAPLMTLVTIVVAVWSLYYSGVQADVARKTFEMTSNEVHASLQKEIADIQKQVAAGASDHHLADILGRLANLQAKLAEQQRSISTGSSNGMLADIQKQVADMENAVAGLKREQDNKDKEIASLRANLAVAQQAKPPLSLLAGAKPTPLVFPFKENSLLSSTLNLTNQGKFPPAQKQLAVDNSFSGQITAWLMEIWSIFCKYPGPSIYFVLAALMALSKLAGRK